MMRFTLDNHIATITLDRPDAGNAIDETAAYLLRDACEQVRQDDNVRVCIITGAGDAFCAGTDFAGEDPTPDDLERLRVSASA